MLSFGEKIAKIGPLDPEIIVLRSLKKEKKKEINASKIYSPFGKCAEWAKQGTTTTHPLTSPVHYNSVITSTSSVLV